MMRTFRSDPLSRRDLSTELSGHHIWWEYAERTGFKIDWMNEIHLWKPLFIGCLFKHAKKVTILSIFSMMRHPSLYYFIVVMNFFVHIMTVMIFLALCNKKFDVLKWAHQMKKWNGRQNMQFFRCVIFYIIKRLF